MKDAFIAAADTGPNSSPLEFMLRLVSAPNLSVDSRIGMAEGSTLTEEMLKSPLFFRWQYFLDADLIDQVLAAQVR
jgi:hypothetical protein